MEKEARPLESRNFQKGGKQTLEKDRVCFLLERKKSLDRMKFLLYNDILYQNGYLYLFRVKIFDFGLKKHRTFFPVLCIFTRLTI